MNGFEMFLGAVALYQPIIEQFKNTGAAEYVQHIEVSDTALSLRLFCNSPAAVAWTLSDLATLHFDLRYLTPGTAKDGSAFLYVYHYGTALCYVCIDASMQDLVQGIEEYREAQS